MYKNRSEATGIHSFDISSNKFFKDKPGKGGREMVGEIASKRGENRLERHSPGEAIRRARRREPGENKAADAWREAEEARFAHLGRAGEYYFKHLNLWAKITPVFVKFEIFYSETLTCCQKHGTPRARRSRELHLIRRSSTWNDNSWAIIQT